MATNVCSETPSHKFCAALSWDWLERAKRSVLEAERLEQQAEVQIKRDQAVPRTSHEAMRDELLLAQAEASIAIAEALQGSATDSNRAERTEPTDGIEFVDVVTVGVRDSLVHREDFVEWLNDHGIAEDLTVELINVGDAYAIVKQSDLDVGGRKKVDDNGVVMAEPFAFVIHRPMPRGPREGAEL